MKLDYQYTTAFNFKFSFHRCHNCGTFWAVESKEDFSVSIGMTICPKCALDEVEKERKKNRKLCGEIVARKAAFTRISNDFNRFKKEMRGAK